MPKEKQRKIATLGGKSQGKHNNPANFANNPKLAALAGRKGGLKVSKNSCTHGRYRPSPQGQIALPCYTAGICSLHGKRWYIAHWAFTPGTSRAGVRFPDSVSLVTTLGAIGVRFPGSHHETLTTPQIYPTPCQKALEALGKAKDTEARAVGCVRQVY